MMGMPIEVRDRWVAALRSGEYEQGVYAFQRGEEFCALGVLCDVLGQPTTFHGIGNWDVPTDLLGEARWEIAGLNDDGATFPQIADWVEQNVPIS